MKIPKGALVEVTFLDHVCTTGGMAAPIRCRAVGELLGEDKQAYYIASWLTEEGDYQNLDSHTILKNVVEKIEVIRKKRRKLP